MELFDTYRACRHYTYDYTGKRYGGVRATPLPALEAFKKAKEVQGKRYYSKAYPDGHWNDKRTEYVLTDDDSSFLMRVGCVTTSGSRRYAYRDTWQSKEGESGWYTDPYGDCFKDGTGLCYGVVYVMRKRDSLLFVPGYQFGGVEGGPVLSFKDAFESDNLKDSYNDWQTYDAALDAARCADDLAKYAAESEREYQAAWQAGNQWADKRGEISTERKALIELLRERRKVKGIDGVPSICSALTSQVRNMLQGIRDLQAECEALFEGRHDYLGFYRGESRLVDAFNEGAGL